MLYVINELCNDILEYTIRFKGDFVENLKHTTVKAFSQ